MNRRLIFFVPTLFALLPSFAAHSIAEEKKQGAETKPPQAPPFDLLKDAIDPFAEGQERAKFLKAAGVDGEMSEAEFKTDQQSAQGFVRAFDRWPLLFSFDENHNKSVDWLEAGNYRKAILTILLAKHDASKDGRLAGAERDEANKALAENKLPDYFNIPCCGGQGVSPETRKMLQQLPDDPIKRREYIANLVKKAGFEEFPPSPNRILTQWRLRKESAMQDRVMFGEESEEKLLPYTRLMTQEEFDQILDPYYHRLLSHEMPEEHWRVFKKNIYRQLKWPLAGDTDGIKARYDMYFNYTTGQDAPKSYSSDAQIERTLSMSPPPVHKLGFADPALGVRRKKPAGFFSVEKLAEMPPDFSRKIGEDQIILTLHMAARYTPWSVYTRGPQFQSLPDDYKKLEFNVMYDPKNKAGSPFYLLPNPTPLFFEEAQRELPVYLHGGR